MTIRNTLLVHNGHLDGPTSKVDIRLGLNKAKIYKALGDDSTPVETLCSDNAIGLLYELCNQCFDNSVVPGASGHRNIDTV